MSAYSRIVLAEPGLVAFWELEEAAGATSVIDSSGNEAPATPANVGFGNTGIPAGGLAANFASTGAATGVTAADNAGGFTLAGAFTLEAWIKPDAAGSGNRVIITNSDGTTAGWNLRMLTGDKIRFLLITDGSNFVGIDTTSAISLGAYHHIVAVYDGSGATTGALKIYVDGALAGTAPVTGGTVTTITTTNHVVIGSILAAGVVTIGLLDEVALYSNALTAAQAAVHNSAGLAPSGVPPLVVPAFVHVRRR